MSFADVLHATWPPDEVTTHTLSSGATLTLRRGAGGGKRVSAASLAGGSVTEEDLTRAEAAMRAMGQVPLFSLAPDQTALDAQLAQRGYAKVDATRHYDIAVATLTGTQVPRVTAFCIWEPLAVMTEIWAAGGIGPDRVAVMRRVTAPKTGLLGRIDDRPAGAGFVAAHGDTAMLHALEIAAAYRRRGLARWMVIAAAHWAAAQGCTRLALLVTEANAPANALYRGLGFAGAPGYHYRVLEGGHHD